MKHYISFEDHVILNHNFHMNPTKSVWNIDMRGLAKESVILAALKT